MNSLTVIAFFGFIFCAATADNIIQPNPCQHIKCGGPNLVCRGSNACADRCNSTICTLELTYGCFCKPGFCKNSCNNCIEDPRITRKPT
ncbi:unnamed protein product [Ceutorhynchus assimilis]|uniref:Uncharacterized protein n=1 Tax=Ceutorhynchus assimilis TaxID=467358 RepID=A0A9N9MIU7_9CUCU|nr:unnamed protein product [Ceutorhynchus assimilis]